MTALEESIARPRQEAVPARPAAGRKAAGHAGLSARLPHFVLAR